MFLYSPCSGLAYRLPAEYSQVPLNKSIERVDVNILSTD